MEVYTKEGTIRCISIQAVADIPTDILARACADTVLSSCYCIPVKCWFHEEGKFPRLRHARNTPSLVLLRRMSEIVAARGTAAECKSILEAVVEQAKRRGAPWSWLSVTVTELLTRCESAYTLQLLQYFMVAYRGPSQYKLTIAPMLLNALTTIQDDHQGVRMALFSLLDHPQYILQLNMEMRLACVAALPAPERAEYTSKIWKTVSKWMTGIARTNFLVLAAFSKLMQYIVSHLNAMDFESEPVWAWIVYQLRVDAYVLQQTLPDHVLRALETWQPVPDSNQLSDACCICMDDLSCATVVGLRTCTHTFHARCLYSWYAKNPHCPVCRAGAPQTRPLEVVDLIDVELDRLLHVEWRAYVSPFW